MDNDKKIGLVSCVAKIAASVVVWLCALEGGGAEVRVARTIRPEGTMFCFTTNATYRPLNDDYAVDLNGRPVEVRACRESRVPFNRPWPGRQRATDQSERASYLAVEANGKIACKVTPKHGFTKAVVRPLSRGIRPVTANGSISFELPGPGYYVLETLGMSKALHIFVESPRDFAEKEKATHYYGPGMHSVGWVHLKSHDRVYVDRDAIVFGCFTGENVEDVQVFGYGVIDGRTQERVFEGAYAPLQPSCLRFHSSRGIRVDGPILMDSPNWSFAFFDCEDVSVRHVKIVGQWRYNTDGLDICNSRRVTVADCFIRSFDDTISIKGVIPYRTKPVEDITVERCVLWCGWGKTLEPGIETWAPHFRRIRFADCDLVRNASSALNLDAGGTAVLEDISFERIRVELQTDIPRPVVQKGDDDAYPADGYTANPSSVVEINNWHYATAEAGEPWGHIRNCSFADIDVLTDDPKLKPKIRSRARAPEGCRPKPYENVTFRCFRINGRVAGTDDFSVDSDESVTLTFDTQSLRK